MAALSNVKHELFAQAMAKGASQREAYIKAGYPQSTKANVTDAAACRLFSDVRVQARIAELQSNAATRAEITLESWIAEGAELMRSAAQAGDHAAASQQFERVAKVAGFWIEKSESTQTFRGFSAQPVSAEEWQQQYAAKQESRPN